MSLRQTQKTNKSFDDKSVRLSPCDGDIIHLDDTVRVTFAIAENEKIII